MQIQDQPISEVLTHFKYLVYGFGCACGVILFLLGVICRITGKYVRTKLEQAADDRKQAAEDRKQLSELMQRVALTEQDIEAMKDHELARSSFSRGLYAISEKMSGFKIEFDNMKEELKDIRWKCERRHVPKAKEDE